MTYSVSRAALEAFYEAYATHDTAKLAPMLHDDIEWIISGPVDVLNWCGTRRGKPAVIDLVDRVIPSLFRVVTFTRSSILMDGDQVATLNRLTARRCADDRVISFRLAHFMRFKDDKVIANLSLIDSFDAVEQMLGHSLAVHHDELAMPSDLVAV
ncbi:MAG: nuclear transport factor 2 family protein [Pseudolabrys sp.]|nr:nuclear transport factor 2 family protein [Pseudolabrys sp.]MDP2297279.1 nuclear transport factor 2 family protein [Pseudolabrys sp.]